MRGAWRISALSNDSAFQPVVHPSRFPPAKSVQTDLRTVRSLRSSRRCSTESVGYISSYRSGVMCSFPNSRSAWIRRPLKRPAASIFQAVVRRIVIGPIRGPAGRPSRACHARKKPGRDGLQLGRSLHRIVIKSPRNGGCKSYRYVDSLTVSQFRSVPHGLCFFSRSMP